MLFVELSLLADFRAESPLGSLIAVGVKRFSTTKAYEFMELTASLGLLAVKRKWNTGKIFNLVIKRVAINVMDFKALWNITIMEFPYLSM